MGLLLVLQTRTSQVGISSSKACNEHHALLGFDQKRTGASTDACVSSFIFAEGTACNCRKHVPEAHHLKLTTKPTPQDQL